MLKVEEKGYSMAQVEELLGLISPHVPMDIKGEFEQVSSSLVWSSPEGVPTHIRRVNDFLDYYEGVLYDNNALEEKLEGFNERKKGDD